MTLSTKIMTHSTEQGKLHRRLSQQRSSVPVLRVKYEFICHMLVFRSMTLQRSSLSIILFSSDLWYYSAPYWPLWTLPQCGSTILKWNNFKRKVCQCWQFCVHVSFHMNHTNSDNLNLSAQPNLLRKWTDYSSSSVNIKFNKSFNYSVNSNTAKIKHFVTEMMKHLERQLWAQQKHCKGRLETIFQHHNPQLLHGLNLSPILVTVHTITFNYPHFQLTNYCPYWFQIPRL